MHVLSDRTHSEVRERFQGYDLSSFPNFKLPLCDSAALKVLIMSSTHIFAFALTISALSASVIPPITNTLVTPTLPAQLNISQTVDDPFPFYFPNEDAAETPALFPMPQCNGVTLEEATIDQLQDYMSQGILTSVEIALCYLERVLQTNDYIKLVKVSSSSTLEVLGLGNGTELIVIRHFNGYGYDWLSFSAQPFYYYFCSSVYVIMLDRQPLSL
jgi:hypothetical protein